jgi:hypothetical protein
MTQRVLLLPQYIRLELLLAYQSLLVILEYFIKQHKNKLLRSKSMNEKAERINGWAAMIGVIAALGAYSLTGQIIPGIW